MLIKSEQLSVGSLIKNVMLKYLFWASYILRLCAQTCTPNRHALRYSVSSSPVGSRVVLFVQAFVCLGASMYRHSSSR